MAEAVDPIILNMKLVDVCQCRPCDCSLTEIPQAILDCFGDSLTQGGDVHRLYVTLGQFSIIRLERDTQLLMPVYDYCMPEKECDCGSDCSQVTPARSSGRSSSPWTNSSRPTAAAAATAPAAAEPPKTSPPAGGEVFLAVPPKLCYGSSSLFDAEKRRS